MKTKPLYEVPTIESQEDGYAITFGAPPDDLCLPAVKAARRLQSLPCEQVHVISLIKRKTGEWFLALVGSGKVEKLT